MNTKLIFPPFWTPTQPYLSLPCLASFVKANNYSIEQYDLNLFCYDKMFSREFIKECYNNLHNKISSFEKESNIESYFKIEDFLIKNVEKSKLEFKSKKSTNFYTYVSNRFILENCLKLISYSSDREKISINGYKLGYNIYSSSSIHELINDFEIGKLNDTIIIKLLYKCIPKLEILKDTLIGISITGISQIIPSILMAKMLKQQYSNIKIVIGGNIPSRWIESFTNLSFLFDFIDYVILNEGEIPLLQLIEYLHENKSIDEVNSLVYRNQSGEIVINKKSKKFRFDQAPAPLFNDKDIGNYYSPEIVLPVLSSRGCYWRKCAFCDHSYVYQNNYSVRPLNKFIEDILSLNNSYNTTYFNFHDEAVSSARMQNISQKLLEEDIKICWSCDAKVEKSLSKQILEIASEAGLKILFFGLESANQRVLNLMQKGIQVSNFSRILEDSTSCGIWNHLFFIQGFPGETKEEFYDTLNFLKYNKDIIQSTGVARFSLNRFSHVALNPLKYNVNILHDNNDICLSFKYTSTDANQSKSIPYDSYWNNEDYKGCYSDLSKYVFRDHWCIFADDIRNYNKSSRQFSDKFFFPWVYSDKKSKIIDLNKGNIIEVKPQLLKIFSLLNEYNKQSLIEFVGKCYDANQEESNFILNEILDAFYSYSLFPSQNRKKLSSVKGTELLTTFDKQSI